MKRSFSFFSMMIICVFCFGQDVNIERYLVPDSINAVGFCTNIVITKSGNPKTINANIDVNNIVIGLSQYKRKKYLNFYGISTRRNEVMNSQLFLNRVQITKLKFDWNYNEIYKLFIRVASDSASGNSIQSGYIYLEKEDKWKLIFSKIYKSTKSNLVTIFSRSIIKKKYTATFSNRWLLRNDNTWKPLDSTATKPPSLRPMPNIDSLAQQQLEEEIIRTKLKDSVIYKDGIFYQHLKEGTGKQVTINDTVVVHYKGWLLSNGEMFDETKVEPATFALKRLIKGWQIGIAQCKVGGKIRLYIPSGLAYGIRTFATDIPPNSTLVFDVELVSVK